MKPLCKREEDFSALYREILPPKEKMANQPSAVACKYVACSHFHKPKKKMPNQFSKKLVALPLAGFLSLPAS